MKVNGSATLNAPVARVWEALRDPAILVRTIPGCQRLEVVGEDVYKMTVTAGVASIKGTYVGEVALTDPDPPHSVVLRARGQGAPGMVDATVRVRLSAAGADVTRLDYAADATVGGMIGGVGQRMLTTVAKRTADEFFADVDRLLTAAPAVPMAAAAAGANGTVSAAVPATAGGVAAGAATGAAAVSAEAGVGVTPEGGKPSDGVGVTAPVAPAGASVYTAPDSAGGVTGSRPVGAFAAGGAVALAGVVVGWLLSRRTRR